MLAVNSNYSNIDNQPHIANELLKSLKQDYYNVETKKILNKPQENIKKILSI